MGRPSLAELPTPTLSSVLEQAAKHLSDPNLIPSARVRFAITYINMALRFLQTPSADKRAALRAVYADPSWVRPADRIDAILAALDRAGYRMVKK